MTTILGIKISNKQESAKNVQNILSEYCCYIKTRLGINSYDEQTCSNEGLILVDIPNSFLSFISETFLSLILLIS